MSKKKILSVIILLIALISLISFSRAQNTSINNETKTYKSIAYGISFVYPKTYFLEEKSAGSKESSRHTLVLTEDNQENQLVREGKSPGREGPVSVTIDIFPNTKNQSVESWIRGMSDSNFKLGDRSLFPITVGKNDALSYRWSGLYEGNSVVFLHKGNVVMMSVTFLSPRDTIVDIFESILETTTLE